MAFYNRGLGYAAKSDYDRAIGDLNQAIQLRIELDYLIQVADGAVIVTFGTVPSRAVVARSEKCDELHWPLRRADQTNLALLALNDWALDASRPNCLAVRPLSAGQVDLLRDARIVRPRGPPRPCRVCARLPRPGADSNRLGSKRPCVPYR